MLTSVHRGVWLRCQTLYVLANIASGTEFHKRRLMANPTLLWRVKEKLVRLAPTPRALVVVPH